jgi:hypothetical protein
MVFAALTSLSAGQLMLGNSTSSFLGVFLEKLSIFKRQLEVRRELQRIRVSPAENFTND